MGLLTNSVSGKLFSVWNDVFKIVNGSSRKLNDPKLDFDAAVAMIRLLKRFVEAKCETAIEYERHGAILSGTIDID